MKDSILYCIGLLSLAVAGGIGAQIVQNFKKLQERYIEAIARVAGHRVRGLYPSLGEPRIYKRGSKARRLQRAYLLVAYRNFAIGVCILFAWLALIIIADWVVGLIAIRTVKHDAMIKDLKEHVFPQREVRFLGAEDGKAVVKRV